MATSFLSSEDNFNETMSNAVIKTMRTWKRSWIDIEMKLCHAP